METPIMSLGGVAADPRPGPRIELRELSVVYPRFRLQPLSFSIAPGERVALVGPNASGKSTTMRVLAGQHADYRGTVLFDGSDLRDTLPWSRARIGFVPETLGGFRWMRVREHLEFVATFFPTWDWSYAEELISRFSLDADERLGALSSGSRVKLLIAAAEAPRPRLLLLDEPTAGLDPVVRRTVMDLVRGAAPRGGDRTVLFSTHLLEDVEWLADRVLVLAHGELRADRTIDSLRDGSQSVSDALFRLIAG